MPDIAMCRNKECPLQDQCYRFTAVANPYRQAYLDFQFVVNEEDDEVSCEGFLE